MSGIPRKKTCTKCNRTLSLKEFGRVSKLRQAEYQKRKWDTYISECKWCVRNRALNYKNSNREVYLNSSRNYFQAKNALVRDTVFMAYGGYVCVCCGETNRFFLTLDHINNDGAKWRREKLGSRMRAGRYTYNWLYKNGCPKGLFQVLCMNCNHGKRMNKGICPHQVRSNDYPFMGVGPSGPKRSAPEAYLGEDIVSPIAKATAALTAGLI